MECIQYLEDNSILNSLPQYDYTSMVDEEEQGIDFGWNKNTVRYVIDNCAKIKATIRRDLKEKFRRKFTEMDVEDIYIDILNYTFKYDDYDLEKAKKFNEDGSFTVISLEGYVFGSAVKNSLRRYIKDTAPDVIGRIDSIIKRDEKEVCILDKIADTTSTVTFEDIENDIYSALKVMECKRYKYGTDIYLIMYIKFRTINEDSFKRFLSVLGINNKIFNTVEKYARNDEDFVHLMQVFTTCKKKEILNTLRNYIYSIDLLDEAIDRINCLIETVRV